MIALALALLLQLKVPDAQQIVGEPKGTPVAAADLDRRTQEVSSLIRCPVCQGLSIADSPSAMAINMKEQVRELLARGFTQEQILDYFEQSYGKFVLLKPEFRGVSSLVWLLPIAVLAFGALIVYSKARKLGQAPAAAKLAPSDDPYLARVRELVEKE
jgi:cytochrome c-type biogenesis protein CcmH